MKEKGFHDEPMGFAEGGMVRSALVLTEVAEAMQEVKRHWGKDGLNQETVKDVLAEELADTVIRLFDMCYVHRVDLDIDVTLVPEETVPVTRRSLLCRLGKIGWRVGRLYKTFEDFGRWTPAAGQTTDEMIDEFHEYFEFGIDVCECVADLRNLCRSVGRDLDDAVKAKMAINMRRPRRYGTPDEGKAEVTNSQN